MAEVFEPLGVCFGSLSFILSTVPAVVEATQTYRECREHFREYERRCAHCKAKYHKWEIIWRDSDFGVHQSIIDETRKDIEALRTRINDEVEKHRSDNTETNAWRKMKAKFHRRGTENANNDFRRSVGYTLYKRKIIEPWITRLEKAIGAIEKLSESEFQNRTAEHLPTNPTQDQISETTKLEAFIKGLTALAATLYQECIETPHTYGWALGLRPPDTSRDVANWRFIADIDIELRFSISQRPNDEHFQLHIRHHKDDPETQLSPQQIKPLVLGQNVWEGAHNTNVKRSIQHPSTRRTHPLGDLFKQKPSLFHDSGWRADRVRLIHEISNWALLLWDSAWIENLCCYGLQIEERAIAQDCARQIFTKGEHGDCRHHTSRLRNLGVVLAEIILATPIWSIGDESARRYEQWVNGSWSVKCRTDIPDLVLDKTTSEPLRVAISFCLEDESPLAKEPFQPGFLFRCIDKVYKPVNEWYKTEFPCIEFYENVPGTFRNEGWSEEAMYQRRQADQFGWTGLTGTRRTIALNLLSIILSAVAIACSRIIVPQDTLSMKETLKQG